MRAIFVIFTTIISIILNGVTLVCLWNWFIIPIFHIQSISFFESLGFVLFSRFLTKGVNIDYDQAEKDANKDTEKVIIECLVHVLMPLIILFIGFLISLFL